MNKWSCLVSELDIDDINVFISYTMFGLTWNMRFIEDDEIRELKGFFVKIAHRPRSVISTYKGNQLPLPVLMCLAKSHYKVKYVNMEDEKKLVVAGFEVTIWPELGSWECYDDRDGFYCSGTFWCLNESKQVVDYDGVFELPDAVKAAFVKWGYDLSLL